MSDPSRSSDDAERSRRDPETPPTNHYSDTAAGDQLATLDARLSALERAVADGETDLHALDDAATLTTRLDDLESRAGETETRIDELDAAVQSLRGYVGAIRAVNREVERRADAALAVADRLSEAGDGEVTALDPPESPDSVETDPAADRSADADRATEGPPETSGGEDLAGRVRDLL